MKSFLGFGLVFLVSRLPFINTGQVFFDSNEYLQRLANPSLFQALSDGHVPLHSGYIVLFWPVWQVFEKIYNPTFFVILFQIVLSYCGVWAFYKTTSEFIPRRAAIFGAFTISLTPLFWITNVTIMMEATYVACFFIALWIFVSFLRVREIYLLILGSAFFFISLLTHLAPLLYLPLLTAILLIIAKQYKAPFSHILTLVVVIGITLIGFTIMNSFLLNQSSFIEGFKTLYFGKTQEASPFIASIEGIGRYARNWFIPMLRNSTTPLFLICLFAFWQSYKKRDWRLLSLFLLWLLPSFIVNQWSDSLWYGRHALISYFGVAFIAAAVMNNKNKLKLVVLLYILIITLPQMFLLRGNIPYLEIQKIVSGFDSKILYIESHFARPQIEAVRDKNVYYVNEPRSQGDLQDRIKETLEQGFPVYISSQALSEPYGLYSGPYLHLLTLSYRNDPTMKRLLGGNFELAEKYIISHSDNLIIYELIPSSLPFTYEDQAMLINSKRRIDYLDPLRHVIQTFRRE